MTTFIKVLSLLSVITLSFACANKNDNAGVTNSTTASATNEATAQSITIKGTVLAVNYGKDGYSAEVKTENEGSFVALVSIVNLGGPGKYQQFGVGDLVTLKGVSSVLNYVNQLQVEEIISVVSAQIVVLDTKYREIKSDESCWQTNKEMTLYAQPDTKSKVEGPHFQGELLKVLGTQIIDNQLWVNVAYSLKVKKGFEGQFADGQVMSSGSPIGWIGGAVVPQISCK